MSWTRQNNAATLSHNRYVLALAHLCTAVLYVMDASEQCGHTVAQQVRVSVSSSVYGRALCHGRVRTMRPHCRTTGMGDAKTGLNVIGVCDICMLE